MIGSATGNGFSLESIVESLVERIAVKVRDRLGRDEGPHIAPRLLTVEQAAQYISRSRAAVQHMVAAAKLPVVRSDRRVFIDVRDLDRWIEENKSKRAA
jgi:excisionase family DNA binding protein